MDLLVYEGHSDLSQKIRQFHSANEVIEAFHYDGHEISQTIKLWAMRHKGKPVFRKIQLNPQYCNGHTFRYVTEGWGLIFLHFGGIKNGTLFHSTLGHFNQPGAAKWEGIHNTDDETINWDWKEIQKTSRKIKYQIHNKFSVRKLGSRGVLPHANQLDGEGIKFW